MKDKKKYKRVLPFITVSVLIAFLFGVIYFNNVVYYFGEDSYEALDAEIIEQGYDGLFAIIPRIKVAYKYNKKDFEKNIILYSSWFFNESLGETHRLYINKAAPEYFIYLYDYNLMKDWLYVPVIAFGFCLFFILYNLLYNLRLYIIKSKVKAKDNLIDLYRLI